jgi:hypothetical protein
MNGQGLRVAFVAGVEGGWISSTPRPETVDVYADGKLISSAPASEQWHGPWKCKRCGMTIPADWYHVGMRMHALGSEPGRWCKSLDYDPHDRRVSKQEEGVMEKSDLALDLEEHDGRVRSIVRSALEAEIRGRRDRLSVYLSNQEHARYGGRAKANRIYTQDADAILALLLEEEKHGA